MVTPSAGAKFFLVEDETFIRLMIADMLNELGHSVVAEAGDIQTALRIAQNSDFQIAVLDINVGGDNISPVAELIEKRKLPFFFASGYGVMGRPVQFSKHPVLQKPFPLTDLQRVIDHCLEDRM